MYIRGDLNQCNPNSEGGPRGCQRLHGLMTETEGYLHGELSSAVLASAVGIDSTFTPRITPAKPGNQGGTFPVAFWSLVNVYYLQLVKDKYPSTWANLLNRGTQDWTKISEIFLAHIDRSTWYLRLALDVNDMTDLLHKDGVPPAFPPYKALSNKCRNLQEAALSVDDVLKPLREALRPSGCKRASA